MRELLSIRDKQLLGKEQRTRERGTYVVRSM